MIQSYGQTWSEQRRFALHALRDLGYGGRSMEETVEEEVDAFLDGISSSTVVTVDERLFAASVLGSLWTIVGGGSSSKMSRLLSAVPTFMSEYVSPLVQVLITRPRAFALASWAGFVSVQRAMEEMLDFMAESIEEHKVISA